MTYEAFIERKSQLGGDHGFEPLWMPDFLFDFQKHLVTWALRKGRAALLEDCGMGKTPQSLVFAENVVRHTNKPVLILAPLSVSSQTAREADKFGIECKVSRDGSLPAKIVVTNYERLHYFDKYKFGGVVCDESAILKNFDGAYRHAITEFMRMVPYKLLCTATPAPNDYIELGTSSEALGELGYMDMLGRFFKSQDGANARGGSGNGAKRWSKNPLEGKFRFRGHAERDFWRWVCSWARALRKPSDMGFDDGPFKLPELITRQHIVSSSVAAEGFLFPLEAHGLKEQRSERRNTLDRRCEMAAACVVNTGRPAVAWCALNDEGDLLEELIPDAVQVCGKDEDDKKEEAFEAFVKGEIRVLVSKPVIAGFGLNWQHCAHQTFFPSHSFEQWYQSIRRSWRFGQTNAVTIDVITSEGESRVLANLQRKAVQAERIFSQLVELMNDELNIERTNPFTKEQLTPLWLS